MKRKIKLGLILVSSLIVISFGILVAINKNNINSIIKFNKLALMVNDSGNLFKPSNENTQKSTGLPTPRAGAAMAYDPSSSCDILFGGASSIGQVNSIGILKDTWSYCGSNWTLLHPLSSPPARAFAAITEFRQDGNLNLQGLNSAQKSNLNKGGTVLFGGMSSNGTLLNDTWIWSNNNWKQVTTLNSPPARDFGSLSEVFFKGHWILVLFGGLGKNQTILDDTWEFNGVNWIKQNPVISPPPLAGASFSVAPENSNSTISSMDRQAILFGGLTNSLTSPELTNDTWLYNGISWKLVQTKTSPPARAGAVFCPAPVAIGNSTQQTVLPNQNHNRYYDLLFGGLKPGSELSLTNSYDDTWIFTGTNWIQQHPIVSPPALAFGSMAISSLPKITNLELKAGASSNRTSFSTLLFGGQLSTGLGEDEYLWDGNLWLPAGMNAATTNYVNYIRQYVANVDHLNLSQVGVTPLAGINYNGITPVVPQNFPTTFEFIKSTKLWMYPAPGFNLVTPTSKINPISVGQVDISNQNQNSGFGYSFIIQYNCLPANHQQTNTVVINLKCIMVSGYTTNSFTTVFHFVEGPQQSIIQTANY